MNKSTWAIAALMFFVIAVTIYSIGSRDSSDGENHTRSAIDSPEVVAPSVKNVEQSSIDLGEPELLVSDKQVVGEQSVVELQRALTIAVQKREDAEEALRVIDLKVGALEAQVNDIELRGDDPADAQDETLDSFQAIFAEYQDTIKRFDEASAEEQWIRDKMEDAGL